MMAKLEVMIVEDESIMRGMLETWLQHVGYSVASASSGRDALNMLAEHEPGVVVTDLSMPVMDGYEFCRRARAGSDVPIMVFTGVPEEEGKAASLEAGTNGYAIKNGDIEHFLDCIRSLITTVD